MCFLFYNINKIGFYCGGSDCCKCSNVWQTLLYLQQFTLGSGSFLTAARDIFSALSLSRNALCNTLAPI
ncbi:hypothetical protein C1N63_06095 [Pantoea ananatis]|nr:hypothetical protein C1N63_06095 [Pantoea ananatis]